jgi:single-stranded DNA-binding protein
VIDALIAGRLYGKPAQRTSTSGKPFATCKVRVSTREGDAIFVNVIAFAEAAVAGLLALSEGDSVALSGELTPKIWQPRDGGEPRPALDLLAHAVLSEYHVQRKRQAMSERAA